VSDKAPIGVTLTLMDPRFERDPYAVLDEVRQIAPVLLDNALHRWFVTGHDEVRALLKGKDMSSDPRNAQAGSYGRTLVRRAGAAPMMLFMDDPEHKRVRSLLNKPFSVKLVEAMRPHIRQTARELLAAITTPEFDLVDSFAGPLPVKVIAEMLGLDAASASHLKEWSDISATGFFGRTHGKERTLEALHAQQQLNALFCAHINERRQRPANDLVSAMLEAEVDGDRLTDEEIVSQCHLLLVAGNATTTDLISNGVKALVDHPSEMAKLRSHPELLGNAVEEILRYDSPVIAAGRTALHDTTIGQCPVRKGEFVTLSLAAANHDPDVYPAPHRFDIERTDVHHQSFGGGRHLCLGATLARVEAQEAIAALLDRYPSLRAASRGHQYRQVPTFRGLAEYWLTSS
jgi:hypothetical protein